MAPRRPKRDDAQLSLFGEWVSAVLGAVVPAAAPEPATPPTVPPQAPDRPPGPPPRTLAPHTAGTVDFRHPQADREILLNESLVAYQLKRAKRKSVGFQVSVDGLVVTAPRWVGQAEVDKLLGEKALWILRKLAEQRDRHRRLQASRIEWCDGGCLPYLGEDLRLLLDARVAGAQLQPVAEPANLGGERTLCVGLPQAATPIQIRDVVQSWLQRQARQIFEARCQHFAQALGVRIKRISLSAAQTRWGSASADGSIRLNWRLVHFSPSVIDYVVAHELAHLREMNHSPAFWEVVRSVVPDYALMRQRLSSEVLPPMD